MPDAEDGPWKLTAKDVVDGRINYSTARRTTLTAFTNNLTDKSRPRLGDVLLTKDGSIGRVAVVDRDGVCINQSVALLRPNPLIDSRFLKYLLFSPYYQSVMEGDSDGSTIKHIYITRVDKMQVAVPPLSEQKEILNVVGSIDDRITLLRETNATLEAIAQALFKSWFVDFDPVRAKLEGRAPEGMDEATARLFPDSFEESELGLVPRGWAIGILSDLLVLQRGFDLPSQDRVPGDFPIIAASGPSGTHHEFMVKGPGVLTGRSGVLGKVFLELEEYWPLNTTLWVKEFRAATPCFAYEVLRMLDFQSFNAGSAVPSLNRNHIHGLRYLIPQRNCIEAYEAIAMDLHTRVKLNGQQAQTLGTLRDTLLPRLISGQLRLPEAQAVAEEALA
jgi:type I restriction enzyme S subunit